MKLSPERLSRLIGETFTIDRLIGQGGQAEVWLARDVALARPVAIKVLRPEATTLPTFAERLRREAQLLARINSPHVVPILQFGEKDGVVFLVMPFVEGETLEDRLVRDTRIAGDAACRILRDAAAGLAAAHAAGIVHRDVKPSNILLDTTNDIARLTDFGIGKALDSAGTPLTETGYLIGSAQYMSPEQFEGASSVGAPSDIYSLGVVAYRLFAGHLPFDGENLLRLAYQHASEPPASLTLTGAVPTPIATLVDSCLAKTPGTRPSASQVMAVLSEVASPAAVVPQTQIGARPVRFVRLAMLLVMTATLGIFTAFFKGEILLALKVLIRTLLKAAAQLL